MPLEWQQYIPRSLAMLRCRWYALLFPSRHFQIWKEVFCCVWPYSMAATLPFPVITRADGVVSNRGRSRYGTIFRVDERKTALPDSPS